MMFDYAATKRWIPLQESGPAHEERVQLRVHVDAIVSRVLPVICVRGAGNKITHWLNPQTRRPLTNFARATHWRKP